MKLVYHLLVVLYSVQVHADLACLKIGAWQPLLGLWCAISPKHAEDPVVKTVTDAALSVVAADKWAVTHHPITVAFKVADAGIENGAQGAEEEAKGEYHDVANATIGFGKELSNQAMSLAPLAEWADMAYCIMGGVAAPEINEGINLATGQDNLAASVGTAKFKRAALQATEAAAQSIMRACNTPNFQELAQSATFNITDPNQKVGATMAQASLMFTPEGALEDGAVQAGRLAKNGWNLVARTEKGAEVARIAKLGEGGTAENFLSEAETVSTKQRIHESEWNKENCRSCKAPSVGTNLGRRRRSRLARRAGPFAFLCCKAPAISGDAEAIVQDTRAATLPEGAPPWITEEAKIYDPTSPFYNKGIPEAAVKKGSDAIRTPVRETLANPQTVEAAIKDLADSDVSTLLWDGPVLQKATNKRIYQILRSAFDETAPDRNPALAQLLKIGPTDGGRTVASSTEWLTAQTDNPALKRLQEWAVPVGKQYMDAFGKLQKLPRQQLVDAFDPVIEFFFTKKGDAAAGVSGIRGPYSFGDQMRFIAQDQPGLVIAKGENAARIADSKVNSWNVVKGKDWRFAGGTREATTLAEFGPEAASEGRVTISVRAVKRNQGINAEII